MYDYILKRIFTSEEEIFTSMLGDREMKGSFKFSDFFHLVKACVPSGVSDENLYRMIMNPDNYDLANINRQINGNAKVPKPLVKKIVFEGVSGIKKRLLKNFSSTEDTFWKSVGNEINALPENVTKCFEQYYADTPPEKLAVLLIEALINTSCSWSKENNADVPEETKTSATYRDIFEFLKEEKMEDLKRVSIMFHSGSNWLTDPRIDGRGALLKKMGEKADVRVLINDSLGIQELFNTEYLRAEFGLYDSIEKTVSNWKAIAQRYRFSLKSFPYIFFHSMCIVEYKNSRKKLYLSNYIYKSGMAAEQHPKVIISDTNPDFATYYQEFDFLWGKGEEIYAFAP